MRHKRITWAQACHDPWMQEYLSLVFGVWRWGFWFDRHTGRMIPCYFYIGQAAPKPASKETEP